MNAYVTVTFVMPEIPKLAKKRSQETEESYIHWYDALTQGMQFARNSGIDPDGFLTIVNNAIKASQFLLIMESLNSYSKGNPNGMNAFNLLISYAHRSSYSLKDWFEVLDYFYDWLGSNCRNASLETILSYILNCIRGRTSLEAHNYKLTELVEQFLFAYGFQD